MLENFERVRIGDWWTVVLFEDSSPFSLYGRAVFQLTEVDHSSAASLHLCLSWASLILKPLFVQYPLLPPHPKNFSVFLSLHFLEFFSSNQVCSINTLF